ncbi:MAG: aspartate aminotransferase [Chloroflexi bacterium RBG_16_57_8]|nr:MAG: aspartate aminotransferase [Chloroflexi bacterium RBG_16_57_8]
MSIAPRIKTAMAQGSWVRRMFEEGIALKQKYGAANVFDLSLGNPTMEPPAEFREELKRLANNPIPGMHRYMENAGYAETRAAVAKQLASETGLSFAADDIIMSNGAAGALNVVLKTVLNPGDEVIIFSPFFVEYVNYVDNQNGVNKIVPTGEGFLPSPALLESAITARTRAIIINSPHNPTGVVYSEQCLHSLGEVVRKKEAEFGTEIYLVSDEAYRKVIYDGLEFPQVLPHHPRTVVLTSHSKDLALPGERIGYIAVHPDMPGKREMVDGLIYCNRTLGFVNAPALMQHVMRRLQGVTVAIAEYQRKRDLLYGALTEMGYSMVKPQGAFYLFPKSPIDDEVAFVRELQELLVLAVPGRGFGLPGYFRVSYCVDDRTIEGSLDGFRKMAQKYGLS